MRNFIILLLFVIVKQNYGQNIADFENLSLEPESYWNGSDLSGTSLIDL